MRAKWLFRACLFLPFGCSTPSSGPALAPAPTSSAPARSNSPAPPQVAKSEHAESAAVPSAAPSEVAAPAAQGKDESEVPETALNLCLANCERLVAKCSREAVQSCRTNCGKYDPPASTCGAELASALRCVSTAPDQVCVNVAPESCLKKFVAFNRCKQGLPELSDRAAQSSELTVFNDERAGFTALMPSPVERTEQNGEPRFRASAAGGVTYEVWLTRSLAARPKERDFLKFASRWLGRCADRLKLHGLIETERATTIEFDANCRAGERWRGLLYNSGARLFALSIRGETEASREGTEFLHGFVAKD